MTSNGMESEFRKDLVSEEWVLIAGGRSKRPPAPKPRPESYQGTDDCPFEGMKDFVTVIENKFPAVVQGRSCAIEQRDGYSITAGVGIHELFIMKDHDLQLYDFSTAQMGEVITAYRNHYREIAATDRCGQYIMIFNNYGREGGASVHHPHSQVISVPIIPPNVMRSIGGSYDYFKKYGVEAHALMIEKEIAQKKRVIFENDQFIAFCPFVSRHPYEMRIYPKFAAAHFDHLEDQSIFPLAEAFGTVLKKMHKNLNDPAFNFFIHTAPLHYEKSDLSFDQYYRWHIELIPRVSFDAGFEAGTGIKINIIDPDYAAQTINS